MKSNLLSSTLAVVGLTVLSTNAPALEPPTKLISAVHPIDRPEDAGNHSGSQTVSGGCPATNVGVLSDRSTIVGTTIGMADNFEAGCFSLPGGSDAIFEFSVDSPGGWSFDTCTVPACWDTTLEIREETGGGCPGDFLVCDGDSCTVCLYESSLVVFLAPSATYYLIVDGWSTFSFGDFEVSVSYPVSCDCTVDADCDDGRFCTGQETCDPIVCCKAGTPPCRTYEGFVAPCDEVLDLCTEIDPCITWITRAGRGFYFPGSFHCPNHASWVFDDVQGSHHTTGLLDFFTTPIIARSTPTGASPLGTPFSVDQALFSVEAGTCDPDAQIAGSQCTATATVDPSGAPAHDLPCSGTMPLLPNNAGNFNVCEIDFFLAYRTTENGAGMEIANPFNRHFLGGPAGADDFGETVIWLEACPPTGVYERFSFFGALRSSDFANAQVCQKPGGTCCAPDGSCALMSESDCAAVGGIYGGTGTIYRDPGSCDDPDGDGFDNLCGDNCPDVFNPDQGDCDGDGEGDACEVDDADDDEDGDGLCNGVDNCPLNVNPNQDDADGDGVGDACVLCLGSDGDAPGARDDDDGDGVLNCNDKCNGFDDAVFGPECEGAIPTTSQWGLIVLTLLLLAGGKILFGIGAKRVARS
ncbi:MAG: IPTL-CTERM sorting domain-containing protein [Planctomycetes bacterium]|nr:IPTL-CTERM sorting domain-containing protein [Planctomycetota bacterium]